MTDSPTMFLISPKCDVIPPSFPLSVCLARMMGGAAAPAAATTATLITAGTATTPPMIVGEETEGPTAGSKGDAVAAVTI